MEPSNQIYFNKLKYLEDQLIPAQFAGAAADLLSNALYGGFSAVYQEEGLPICFVGKGLLQNLGIQEAPDFYQGMDSRLLMETVHPDDRTRLINCLMHCGSDGFQLDYRVKNRKGDWFWIRGYGKQIQAPDGRTAVLVLHIDITESVLLREKLKKKGQDFEEYNRTLATLTANVPGGVCEVVLDEDLSLLYANQGFYDFYGYTAEQMEHELDNKLVHVIWPEDMKNVRKALDEALSSHKSGFEIEHRILRRDGAVWWSFVRGNFSLNSFKNSVLCVVVDITNRKKMEEELRVNEERFRIALAQTDNTIFDYDIHAKRMMHADKSAEEYGLSTWTENVPDSLVENGVIHPDSVEGFLEMYRKIREGAPTASCIVQSRSVEDGYVWRKITMTNVFDGSGHAVRAVGILEDIDDQKRREKALLDLSERDTLTHLFNKGATEARISECLSEKSDVSSALFIIDIDDFKRVNDNHGHLFGDHVIAEGANRIVTLFRKDDIIGRIGGDEFVAYIRCPQDIRSIAHKAEEICKAFLRPFMFDRDSVEISCSVGIAISGEKGTTFETLYKNVDTALYDAKKCGKNQYHVYDTI